MGTPAELQEQIVRYYEATSEGTYLGSWGAGTYAVHLGMDEGDDVSHEQALLRTNAYVAERLGVRMGHRLLDAGCGLGGTSIWMARELGVDVTAINIVEHQLEHARRLAAEHGVADKVRFVKMDYAALEFEDSSFDAAWNIESFCHAVDPRRYLRDMARALAPAGRYGCLECFRVDRRASTDIDDLCAGWMLPSLLTIDEAAEAFRGAGLCEVEVSIETPRMLRSAERMEAMALLRLRQFDVAKVFDADVDPVLVGHARAAVGMTRAMRSGSLVYAFVRGTKAG